MPTKRQTAGRNVFRVPPSNSPNRVKGVAGEQPARPPSRAKGPGRTPTGAGPPRGPPAPRRVFEVVAGESLIMPTMTRALCWGHLQPAVRPAGGQVLDVSDRDGDARVPPAPGLHRGRGDGPPVARGLGRQRAEDDPTFQHLEPARPSPARLG